MKSYTIELSDNVADRLIQASEIVNIKEEEFIKWIVFEYLTQR